MSKTARPIAIDADLMPGGNDRDLDQWVKATRIIMEILERKRLDSETLSLHSYQFSRVRI